MGDITMPILLALLAIGTASSTTLDNWNIETSCPLTSRPTYQSHPLNCNFYLFCTGKSLMPFLQRCPRGQAFDRNLGYCTDSSQAKCTKNPNPFRALPIRIVKDNYDGVPCGKSDYIRYVPHPINCSRFYECSVASVVEMECPLGFNFIPHLELCGRSTLTCDVSLKSDINRPKRDCRKIALPKCPTINTGYSLRLPHQDCDSFYHCMQGVPVKMRCPPGLHFNPLSQECDFPAKSNCKRCPSINGVGETGKGDELIHCPNYYGLQENIKHPKFCDRFYSCASGYLTQRQCPSGLLFNQVTQQCDVPTSVHCNANLDGMQKPGYVDDEINHCHDYEDCKHGSLLPNPSDCSSFYICVWGQPVLMKCPADLYFNPKLMVCDWSWNVECEDDSSSSSSDSSSSSSSSSEGDDSDENESDTESPDPDSGLEEMSSETDEKDQEEGIPAGVSPKAKKAMKQINCPLLGKMHECEMPKCPPYNYGYVVQFYNPFNCSEFYKCSWGEAIKFPCPSGLHYNRRLQVCDYPETADCLPCDDKKSKSSESNLFNPRKEALPRKPSMACKSGITSLPDLYECGSYYTCQDGELAKKPCPRGLHYNPVLKVCDFPYRAYCGVYRQRPISSCPEIDMNACFLGTEVFVNPNNCSSYYQCEKGRLALKECPAGLEFNAVMKLCDKPQNSRCKHCVEGREKRAECLSSLYGQSTVLPDPTDCNAYYRCEWGAMVPYKCPDGLHFNSILEVCDLPERSGCNT